MRVVGGAVCVFLAIHAAAQAEQAAQQAKGNVTVKARAGQPDQKGQQTISLTMTIAQGWHTFAHEVKHPDYEAAKTRLSFAGANGPKVVRVDYPPGTPMKQGKDDFLGYEGEVQIRAVVERAGSAPLEMLLHFQVCDENNCFPSKVKVTIP